VGLRIIKEIKELELLDKKIVVKVDKVKDNNNLKKIKELLKI